MSKIKVDIDRVNDLTPSFSQVTTKVSNTTDNVASIRSQIDYRIKARHGIGDQLYKISNELQTIEKNMQKLVSFLQNSMDKYAEAEQKIARQVPELPNMIGKNNKSIDENDSMKVTDAQSNTSESDESNPFIETWNSFKEIGKDFFDGLEERGEKALDSPYDFFNYLSIGALDGLNSGLKSRNEKKFDSTYDFFNYLTLGFTDTAKEAILPEDPFSKEHWLNSLGVVTTVAGLKGATPKTGSLKNGNDIKVSTNKTSGSVQAGIEDLSIDKYLNQIKNNIQELTNVAGNGLNMMPATGVATGAGVTMMKGLDNFQGPPKTAIKTENIGDSTKPVDKVDEGNIKGTGESTKNVDKIDYGAYLKKNKGDPPSDMYDPHAHHIVFKKGNGKAQKELVKEGQDILREYDIDPIIGLENLVWAPNRVKGQHSIEALRNVVDNIKKVRDAGGDREDMVEMLEKLGDIAKRRR
ncbi:AHH domain-containing protein [Ureibacillus sp. 179-F W5.1 NHS]|uniref:AHH domain-containing protein n=1 Tax=unclassified Ureibacillus TaxID=2638520 RepID=UPI003119422D